MWPTRGWVVVGLVAASAALTSCGGGSGASITVRAADEMAAAKYVQIDLSSRQLDPRDPSQDSKGTTVALDLVRHRMRIHSPRGKSASSGLCSPSPCEFEVTETPEETSILIGNDMWIHSDGPGGFGEGLVAPGKWLHEPRRGAAGLLSYYDPSTWLSMLRASDDAKFIDHQTLHGLKTAHYRFAPRLTAQKDRNVHEDIELDVWISHDELVRRLRMTMTLVMAPTKHSPRQSTTDEGTLDFHDFGTPIDIEPPPAADVAELPACATRNGGCTGSDLLGSD